MFITFEGGEGSGKTTLIAALRSYLEEMNLSVVTTREPGGSRIAEKIRKVILDIENTDMTPRTEALLYAASRVQHLDEVVIPALNANQVVLCDRYLDSSLAYQGYARGLGFESVLKINTYALDYLPNLTFYIDLDPNIGLERIKNRSQNRLDKEQLAFHLKVREGYLKLAELYKDRISVINGNQPIEDIIKEVLAKIKEVI
ncbi:Thymidylate kinase (dTMP kinase) [Paracholeplasma brassicae]|uniref:Thymidylate kinase n=1 Tax=Acholeplasma brassicae TaxID=61635 RepID=U4KMD6_9MOLU|nr:dTMP kinase [Paracholeplasma brassicae]CCV65292.1 Thymidylate kinase (dTMP kinase) [Paracholeplasma brassicae]